MTASPEILAAIVAWDKPIQAKAALAAIFEGEGGISFRTLFGWGTMRAADDRVVETRNAHGSVVARRWLGDLSVFPSWPGAQLASGAVTHAAGAGQDQPATWAGVSAKVGRALAFEPHDQLDGNWFLAQHDFAAHGGGDLLASLVAGHPELVSTYLPKVWPGGADSGFAKRYHANLAVLSTPAPPPPPMPPYAHCPPITLSIQLSIAPSPDGQSLVVTTDDVSATAKKPS